jgi:hypothetical protein
VGAENQRGCALPWRPVYRHRLHCRGYTGGRSAPGSRGEDTVSAPTSALIRRIALAPIVRAHPSAAMDSPTPHSRTALPLATRASTPARATPASSARAIRSRTSIAQAPASRPTMSLVAIVLVAVALLGCACAPSALAPHRSGTDARSPSRATAGTLPSGAATSVASVHNSSAAPLATKTFCNDIGNATAAFVAEVGQLQADLTVGNVPAAKSDELAAQSDYDVFRMLETDDSVNASTLDETITDVLPGQSFGGLHAVERDLWTSGDALSDASGLEAQAPVAEFLLSKVVLPPEAIGTTGVDELSWVNDVAIPGREELYSHLDAVDIAATIAAADQAFEAIEPLARGVAPALDATVAQRFGALEAAVADLGPVTQLPDSAITAATRLSLSQQVDATAAGLAQLSALLTPFGTSSAST